MKYLILLLILITLSACGGTFQAPPECQDTTSVILSITGDDPTRLGGTLLAANFFALEKGEYSAAEVQEVLLDIKAKLNTNVSYFSLMNYLKDTVDTGRRIAAASIILGADVSRIADAGGGMFITKCDKAMLNTHIDDQLDIVSLY